MTVRTPAVFTQAGSYPAENVRQFIAALARAGIVGAADLAVSANGAPNMSVNVAAGAGFIPGTEATYQGTYFFQNDGAVNLPVTASDPTNPRKDIVVAQVRDSAYSGGTSDARLAVIAGIPSGAPALPAFPPDVLWLATINVPANAGSIVAGNIVDQRARATSLLVPDTANNYTGMARADAASSAGWATLDSITPAIPNFTPNFPYRLVVIANGRVGFGNQNNAVSLRIDDGAGNDITDTSVAETYLVDCTAGKWQAASLIAHLDRAAGQASTFNLAYFVGGGGTNYIRLGIEAFVIPR